MSADRMLEREVATALIESAPSREPDLLYDSIVSATGRVRPRPRWLAILKEPPMRYRSHLASGSPTLRLASVLALTLALILALGAAVVAGASLLPSQPPAGPPYTIVVDGAGNGDALTIAQGVSMALAGDTVRVMPGTYAEQVVIDKPITLEGDPGSAREAIKIPYDADSPTVTSYWDANLPNGILLRDASVTVRHLSVEGAINYGIGIAVNGGDVLLEDLSVVLPGEYAERVGGGGRWAIHIGKNATGTIRDVTARGYIAIVGGAAPTVEHVVLIQDGMWLEDSGAATIVRDSDLPYVFSQGNPLGTVTGDLIAAGVEIDGGALEIVDNSIGAEEHPDGVVITSGTPRLIGNTIFGKGTAIEIGGGASAVIEGNTITDNRTGILIQGTPATTLSITGNTFCRNTTDLDAPAGPDLTLDGNTVCEASGSGAP